jgi:hypothetical protein
VTEGSAGSSSRGAAHVLSSPSHPDPGHPDQTRGDAVESFALTIARSATQNYWLSPAGRRIADTVAGPSNPQGLVLGLIPYTPTTSPNSMINFRYVALLEQAHLRSTSFRKSPLSSNPESIQLSF